MSVKTKSAACNPTVVDAASLFDACDAIAERLGRTKLTLDYAKLRERLDALREQHGWHRASGNTILLSIDPSSEGQQRFQAMLKHSGFEIDPIHYREAFVSPPPGRNPSDLSGKPITSLAARLAYIAGLMARHDKREPELLIVSHWYELCSPLTDLARRLPEGKVGIAYFGSLLDYRWKGAGLFELGSPQGIGDDPSFQSPSSKRTGLKFFDLEPYCQELLGEKFPGGATDAAPTRDGLSRF